MIKILIGFIFFLDPSIARAQGIDLDADYYSYLEKTEAISFQISSQEVKELVKQKLILENVPNLNGTVFYHNGSIDLVFEDTLKIPKNTLDRIKESYIKKARIVTGADFMPWIKGYSQVQTKHLKKYHFEEESGLLDRSDIFIHEKEKKLIVTEKYPTGEIVSEYYFITPPWSKGKKVISKVVRSIDTGNKDQKIETSLSYGKQKNGLWMPEMITINTSQVLNVGTESEVSRKIVESFTFSNYVFKSDAAIKHFSQQK